MSNQEKGSRENTVLSRFTQSQINTLELLFFVEQSPYEAAESINSLLELYLLALLNPNNEVTQLHSDEYFAIVQVVKAIRQLSQE